MLTRGKTILIYNHHHNLIWKKKKLVSTEDNPLSNPVLIKIDLLRELPLNAQIHTRKIKSFHIKMHFPIINC